MKQTGLPKKEEICPSCKRLGRVYLTKSFLGNRYYEIYHDDVICKYRKQTVDIQTSMKQRPWTANVRSEQK